MGLQKVIGTMDGTKWNTLSKHTIFMMVEVILSSFVFPLWE